MNRPPKNDLATRNHELRIHLPLLIRWGVACLMMIGGLTALAAKGEGEIHFAVLGVFVVVWLGCLLKTGQSAFMVVAALMARPQDADFD